MRLVRLSDIDTPSQRWARMAGACLSGRRRLGRKSVYEYWRTARQISDLMWIADHLKPLNLDDEIGYKQARQRANHWVKGAWRYPSRMRKALIAIMSSFDVRWPTEIL